MRKKVLHLRKIFVCLERFFDQGKDSNAWEYSLIEGKIHLNEKIP